MGNEGTRPQLANWRIKVALVMSFFLLSMRNRDQNLNNVDLNMAGKWLSLCGFR